MQLIILAAGLSKRYGRPKQLEEIFENKTLTDYNIENAKKSKVNDIIIVTNEKIENKIKEKYSLKAKIIISNTNNFTSNSCQLGNLFSLYCTLDYINSDFIVINADDYYEKSVFKKSKKFLEKEKEDIAIIAYKLKNVLSSNGPVNRGVIIQNKKYLVDIKETMDIVKTNNIIKDNDENILDKNTLVSMGFYIFKEPIKKDIKEYVEEAIENKEYLKGELRLTEFISSVKTKYKVKVIKTSAKWTGITFKEDKKDAYNFFKNKC